VFSVFSDAVMSCNYLSIDSSGFETDAESSNTYPAEVIIDNFSTEDLKSLNFSVKVQVSDLKGVIRGKHLTDLSSVNPNDEIVLSNGVRYFVRDHDVDPFKALYTFVLRGA
jgi:hypothetical protein